MVRRPINSASPLNSRVVVLCGQKRARLKLDGRLEFESKSRRRTSVGENTGVVRGTNQLQVSVPYRTWDVRVETIALVATELVSRDWLLQMDQQRNPIKSCDQDERFAERLYETGNTTYTSRNSPAKLAQWRRGESRVRMQCNVIYACTYATHCRVVQISKFGG